MADINTQPLRAALARLRRRDIRWGDWAAPALILTAPFVNFLGYLDYGLLTPESLLAVTLLAGIGLLASLALTWRPRLLRPLLLATALVFFLDVQPDLRILIAGFLQRHLPLGGTIVHWQIIVVLGCFPLFFVVLDALKDRAGTVLSVVFSVMIAATLVLPSSLKWQRTYNDVTISSPAAGMPQGEMPTVLHIVFDEQIGVEGLPADVPGAVALREELRDFYVGNGFRLYGKSFSRYFNTENSLANAFNGESRDRDMAFLETTVEGFAVTQNAWFDRLSAQGYRIKVYQTSHLDFCADVRHRIAQCITSSSNALPALTEAGIGVTKKVRYLLDYYRRHSVFLNLSRAIGLQRYSRSHGEGHETEITAGQLRPPSLGPLSVQPLVERLIGDLRDAAPGMAYFAHFLLPHRGYVLDDTCRLKPDMSTWYSPTDVAMQPGERLSDSYRSTLYTEYFKQVRCAHQLLARALDAMAEAGVADEAIIVVHGDHGSRIFAVMPSEANASRLEGRDLIDGFSALFAIRSPGLEAGYDERMRSVQALFAELMLGRPIADADDTVFLVPAARAADMRLERHPMPRSWPSDRHSTTAQGSLD